MHNTFAITALQDDVSGVFIACSTAPSWPKTINTAFKEMNRATAKSAPTSCVAPLLRMAVLLPQLPTKEIKKNKHHFKLLRSADNEFAA